MRSLAALALSLALVAPSLALAEEVPRLLTGDLVLQTSRSSQSAAILAATKSPYSHIGMVVERKGKLYVVEAAGPVGYTPLSRWIARGKGGRYTALRVKGLDDDARAKLAVAAKRYLGRPYDPLFAEGEQRLYCSEFVWAVFRDVGIELTGWRKVGELDLDARAVRALMAKRWRKHPACKKEKRLEGCLAKIEDGRILPPGDLAEDERLELVFTSFPTPAPTGSGESRVTKP